MNGPPTLFWIVMLGESFHEPLKSCGRLIDGSHATSVENVSPYSTRRTPPGTVGSWMRNSSRSVDRRSVMVTPSGRFHRPMRRGVCKDRVLVRASWKCSSVSPGIGIRAGPLRKFFVVVSENPGDHVIHDVMSIGAGVSLTSGNEIGRAH